MSWAFASGGIGNAKKCIQNAAASRFASVEKILVKLRGEVGRLHYAQLRGEPHEG